MSIVYFGNVFRAYLSSQVRKCECQDNISTQNKERRRKEDVLKWDDNFMAIAFLSGRRSKDPKSQVGACIVNKNRRICGIGYNGMPDGCHDDILFWGCGPKLENKLLYVCHAERNAIVNKNSTDVRGCTIYTSLFPCNECAKIIIQSGLTEVVYYSDKKKEKDKFRAARLLFRIAGVKRRELRPSGPITIDFTDMDDDQNKTPQGGAVDGNKKAE